jgi:hypothetical protein
MKRRLMPRPDMNSIRPLTRGDDAEIQAAAQEIADLEGPPPEERRSAPMNLHMTHSEQDTLDLPPGPAYIVSTSSVDCSFGTDRLHVVRTATVLSLMNIPAERARFYWPDDPTVHDPRLWSDVASPPLNFPGDYANKKCRGRGDWRTFLEEAFDHFNAATGITVVVWIHTGHGLPGGLSWPQATRRVEGLMVEDLVRLFERSELPIIMIVDACYLGNFMKAVLDGVGPQQVACLASCDERNAASLPIISEKQLDGLTGFERDIDGKTVSAWVRVDRSLCFGALLALFTYAKRDLPLSQLPEMVNAGPHDGLPAVWGFCCEYIATTTFGDSVGDFTLGALFHRQLFPLLDVGHGLTLGQVVSPYPLASHYDGPQKWMLLRRRGGGFDPTLIALHAMHSSSGLIFCPQPLQQASGSDPAWLNVARAAITVCRGDQSDLVIGFLPLSGMFRLSERPTGTSDPDYTPATDAFDPPDEEEEEDSKSGEGS